MSLATETDNSHNIVSIFSILVKNIEPTDHYPQLQEIKELIKKVNGTYNKHQPHTRHPREFKKAVIRSQDVDHKELLVSTNTVCCVIEF